MSGISYFMIKQPLSEKVQRKIYDELKAHSFKIFWFNSISKNTSRNKKRNVFQISKNRIVVLGRNEKLDLKDVCEWMSEKNLPSCF